MTWSAPVQESAAANPAVRETRFELGLGVLRLAAALLVFLQLLAGPPAVTWTAAEAVLLLASGLTVLGLHYARPVLLGNTPIRVLVLAVDLVIWAVAISPRDASVDAVSWAFGVVVIFSAAFRWQEVGALAVYAVMAAYLIIGALAESTGSVSDQLGRVAVRLIVLAAVSAYFSVQSMIDLRGRERERRASAAFLSGTRRLDAIVDNVADGVVTLDTRGRIVRCNGAAQQLLRSRGDEILDQPFASRLDQSAATTVRSLFGAGAADAGTVEIAEAIVQCNDGATVAVELRAAAMDSETGSFVLLILRDISEQRAHRLAMEQQALHDALTGLPNRVRFNDRLHGLIEDARANSTHASVLLMDLDHFKDVNDSLGHHVGDMLLVGVANRLRSVIRDGDLVARLGGDEFGIIPLTRDAEQTSTLCARIMTAFDAPFILDDQIIDADVSIGIAHYPEHGEEAPVIMRHADVAMYSAKRARRGFAVYNTDQDPSNSRRLSLAGDLRRAIENNELVLHYQPQIDLASGAVVGAEALIRWQHSIHGLLPPSEFIPLAEQSEVIRPLTRWLIDAALRQVSGWRAAGLDLEVAVNVPGRSLHDDHFPLTVQSLMERWRFPPAALTLEITENAIVMGSAVQVLARLRDMGLRLSIDDFGVGYSSLAYLRRLPTHEVKLDRSFVAEMTTSSSASAIVRSTIELAHNLSMTVVAEGVETEAILDLLRGFHCDRAQGYFISRPIPAADFAAWVTARAAVVAPRRRFGDEDDADTGVEGSRNLVGGHP